jgi:hypothetical protein
VHDVHRRSRLALPGERAPPHVAKPPADHCARLDVDDQQRLFEARPARDDLALVVEHARVSVENQLVLAADRVAERDEAGVVARTRDEHLLALDLATDVERRRADVHEQLRAREREVGRRRPRLPHVLADGQTDERLAELEQHELAPGREVAVLVEDAVVRQESLAVDRLDVAVRADRARVEEVLVEMGEADDCDDVLRFARDLAQRRCCGADEARPQEQIFGRVAGDGELREEDEFGARLARFTEPREDEAAVAVEVPDDGVDLSEREPHRVFASEAKTSRVIAAGE